MKILISRPVEDNIGPHAFSKEEKLYSRNKSDYADLISSSFDCNLILPAQTYE